MLAKQQNHAVNVAYQQIDHRKLSTKSKSQCQISKYVLPTSVAMRTMAHHNIMPDMYGYCLSFRPNKIKGSKIIKMKQFIGENVHVFLCQPNSSPDL